MLHPTSCNLISRWEFLQFKYHVEILGMIIAFSGIAVESCVLETFEFLHYMIVKQFRVSRWALRPFAESEYLHNWKRFYFIQLKLLIVFLDTFDFVTLFEASNKSSTSRIFFFLHKIAIFYLFLQVMPLLKKIVWKCKKNYLILRRKNNTFNGTWRDTTWNQKRKKIVDIIHQVFVRDDTWKVFCATSSYYRKVIMRRSFHDGFLEERKVLPLCDFRLLSWASYRRTEKNTFSLITSNGKSSE